MGAEGQLLAQLRRVDLTQSELEGILRDPEARRFHAVRLALASHRLTPRSEALSLVETLFSYDLAHLSADVRAHPDVRRAADRLLLRRACEMALAERMHLARTAGRGMLSALRHDPDPRVVAALLDNRFSTEADVLGTIGPRAHPETLAAVAPAPPLERAPTRPRGGSLPSEGDAGGPRRSPRAGGRRRPDRLERLARSDAGRPRRDAKNPCAPPAWGLASCRISGPLTTIQGFHRRMNHTRPSGPSFGDELRRERLVREVTLEEISAATKISLRLLSALERSDLAKLPAPVFTRGFIRAYCLHLGLDPVDKINTYLSVVETGAPPLLPSGKPGLGSRFLRGRRSTAGTILGGVTAVLLLLGLIASPDHKRSDTRVSGVARVEPVSFKNVSPSNEPTPLIREDTQELQELSTSAGGIALVLEFDEPSWIEISADGAKIFGGLVTAGESRRFEAQKDFRVTLGNAGGVRVSVDGRPGERLGRPGEVVRNVILPDSPSRG